MGYRANVITQHREYGAQSFSDWSAFEKFVNRTSESLNIEFGDGQNIYSVDKDVLKEYINNLPEDSEPSDYGPFTNKELKHALEVAILESPDEYVAWEWF